MDAADLLVELYDRILPLARSAVEGLDAGDLAARPGPDANPIGWLVWHMGRVIDAQVSVLAGEEQVWVSGDWAGRVGLEPDPANSGYGHSQEEVAAVRPDGPAVLTGYLEAVIDRAKPFVGGLGADDLDRVVDRNYDPPVTLGVRLASVAEDCLQHAGQAAFAKGLLANR